MEKYKTQFKLEAVNSFLAGEGGAKLLARRWIRSFAAGVVCDVCRFCDRYGPEAVFGERPVTGSQIGF